MAITKLSDDEIAVVSGATLTDKAEGILAFSRSIRDGLVSIAGTAYEKVRDIFSSIRK